MRERLAKILEQTDTQPALEKGENGRPKEEISRTGSFE